MKSTREGCYVGRCSTSRLASHVASFLMRALHAFSSTGHAHRTVAGTYSLSNCGMRRQISISTSVHSLGKRPLLTYAVQLIVLP